MKYIIPKLSFTEYIYLFTAVIVVFFMTFEYVVVNMMILFVIFILLLAKKRGNIKIPKTLLVLLGFLSILLIQIVLNPSQYFEIQEAFKEISRLLIYGLIILIVSNLEISSKFLLKIWGIIFLLTIIIAGLQFYKLFGINDLLTQLYGESIYFEIYEKYTSLSDFRSGSIFINPNGYAKFILSFLALFLGIALIKIGEKKILVYLMGAGIITALVLTGSRTGFLVSIILIALYFIHSLIKNKQKLSSKKIVIFISLLMVISIMLSLGLKNIEIENMRFMQVGAGIDNSLEYKFSTFYYLLKQFDIHNLFIGLGSFEGIWGVTTIDFDIGYLVIFYGVLGLILYLFMLHDFLSYRKKINSNFYMLNKYLVIVIVLFGFTGGIFLNLRTFSMMVLLLFVNITEENKKREKEANKPSVAA